MAKQKRKQIEKLLCYCGKITNPKYSPCCSMSCWSYKFECLKTDIEKKIK